MEVLADTGHPDFGQDGQARAQRFGVPRRDDRACPYASREPEGHLSVSPAEFEGSRGLAEVNGSSGGYEPLVG